MKESLGNKEQQLLDEYAGKIDAILERGDLVDYHLAHAARAEFCRRSGKMSEAKNSYARALSLARQEPERRFLTRRLSEIRF